MEAVLGSNRTGSDRIRTPPPQHKSILSRNANQKSPSGKENMPGTLPTIPIYSARRSDVAGSSQPSAPKTTSSVAGSEAKSDCLRYTSLSELVIPVANSPYNKTENFGTSSPAGAPRTPMKDALVEKAVRAYLQPSESFVTRSHNSGWGMCVVLRQFLPSFVTKFSLKIPNPFQFFCCAAHAFSMYLSKRTLPMDVYLLRENGSESGRTLPP